MLFVCFDPDFCIDNENTNFFRGDLTGILVIGNHCPSGDIGIMLMEMTVCPFSNGVLNKISLV